MGTATARHRKAPSDTAAVGGRSLVHSLRYANAPRFRCADEVVLPEKHKRLKTARQKPGLIGQIRAASLS